MKPALSVLIACHGEQAELNRTIASLRETAGDGVQLVIVDDCSPTPLKVDDPDALLIANKHRIGVGASRHLAALYAQSDHLLITDCHVRFDTGWYETAMARISNRSNVLHCAACLGFTGDRPGSVPDGNYRGATFNFHGPDRNAPGLVQVFEPVWLSPKEYPKDDGLLPCVMGAGYFISRNWFFHIGGLRFLRYWGGDETLLSLKTWLAGGEVRLLDSVHIWHRFRTPAERLPYGLKTWWKYYNKLFAMHTILDSDRAAHYAALMPRGVDLTVAWDNLKADWNLVSTERAYNRSIFLNDFDWFCAKFGLHP